MIDKLSEEYTEHEHGEKEKKKKPRGHCREQHVPRLYSNLPGLAKMIKYMYG